MTPRPTVSVVLPFFNEERFIAEAIESVLAQTFGDWELFLVDDGSSDASSETARAYAARLPDRIHYLEHAGHTNHGRSATRNLAVGQSLGEFVTFIDADDRWTPTKLDHQLDLLRRTPRAGLAAGRMTYWFSWTGRTDDLQKDFVQPFDVPLDAVIEPPVMLTAYLRNEWSTLADILVRRSAIEHVGAYESAFRGMYDDQVFHAKLCLAYPIVTTSQSSYIYRQHDRSCVATASGHDRTDGRRRFLLWLGTYLDAHPTTNSELLAVIDQEVFPLRHPRLARLRDRFRSLRSRLAQRTKGAA